MVDHSALLAGDEESAFDQVVEGHVETDIGLTPRRQLVLHLWRGSGADVRREPEVVHDLELGRLGDFCAGIEDHMVVEGSAYAQLLEVVLDSTGVREHLDRVCDVVSHRRRADRKRRALPRDHR